MHHTNDDQSPLLTFKNFKRRVRLPISGLTWHKNLKVNKNSILTGIETTIINGNFRCVKVAEKHCTIEKNDCILKDIHNMLIKVTEKDITDTVYRYFVSQKYNPNDERIYGEFLKESVLLNMLHIGITEKTFVETLSYEKHTSLNKEKPQQLKYTVSTSIDILPYIVVMLCMRLCKENNDKNIKNFDIIGISSIIIETLSISDSSNKHNHNQQLTDYKIACGKFQIILLALEYIYSDEYGGIELNSSSIDYDINGADYDIDISIIISKICNILDAMIELSDKQLHLLHLALPLAMKPFYGLIILLSKQNPTVKMCNLWNKYSKPSSNYIQFLQKLSLLLCKFLCMHHNEYKNLRSSDYRFMREQLHLILGIRLLLKNLNDYNDYNIANANANDILFAIIQTMKNNNIFEVFGFLLNTQTISLDLEKKQIGSYTHVVKNHIVLVLQCLDEMMNILSDCNENINVKLQMETTNILTSQNISAKCHHWISVTSEKEQHNKFQLHDGVKRCDVDLIRGLLPMIDQEKKEFGAMSCDILSQIMIVNKFDYQPSGHKKDKNREKLMKKWLDHKIPLAVSNILKTQQDGRTMRAAIRLITNTIQACNCHQILFMLSHGDNRAIISALFHMYFGNNYKNIHYNVLIQIFSCLTQIMDKMSLLPLQLCKRHYKHIRLQSLSCITTQYPIISIPNFSHSINLRLKNIGTHNCQDHFLTMFFMFFHLAIYLYKYHKSLKAGKYFLFCIDMINNNTNSNLKGLNFDIYLNYYYSLYLYKIARNYKLSLHYVLNTLNILKHKNIQSLGCRDTRIVAMGMRMRNLRSKLIRKIGLNRYCHNHECKRKFLFETPKTCKGCKSVYYCNKMCQKADWVAQHRWRCYHCF